MKIFYVSSTEFYKKHKDEYFKTIKMIKEMGHDVYHFTDSQSQEFDYDKEETEIISLIKKIENTLKQCDLLIADITISSAGPGYDIATAINLKKPVLVLKRKDDTSPRGPHPITTKKSRLLSYVKYNDNNIKGIIEEFIENAKAKLDTKFILIIPPEIDRYLEWASDYKRMHKAQIVREAMEDLMNKDKDWKEYLSDEG